MTTYNKSKFGLALLVLPILISCDYTYLYKYEMLNNSDFEVEIKVFAGYEPIDTTYVLQSKELKLIYMTNHGVEGAKGPFYRDVEFDLDEINVRIKDSNMSNRDYRSSDNWEYSKGVYSATITNDEFE